MHSACQPHSRRVEGSIRSLATVGPPAEMRGEVRAKQRGVWRRLTNQLYAGNGTNRGYSLGLCCSFFISLFSFTSLPYLPFSIITLCSGLSPLFHCCQSHESCDWGSCALLSLTATSKFQIAPLQFFHQPLALVSYSPPRTSPSDCYAVSSHQGDAHTIHHNAQILSARIWSSPN